MKQFLFLLVATLLSNAPIVGNSDFGGPAKFELCQGFIIVSAEYGGQKGDYIIDSGAPGLVLNSLRHQLSTNETIAIAGTGGQIDGSIVRDKDFIWRVLAISDIEAIAIDLNYLEEALQRPISGLIGFDVFSGYDLIIDYGAQTITLAEEAFDHEFRRDYHALAVERHEHVLTVQMTYGNSKLRFALDTGSKSNLIGKAALATINPDDIVYKGDMFLVGADQAEVLTRQILVNRLNMSMYDFPPIHFVVADLSGINTSRNPPIDGILGVPFFEDARVVIAKDRQSIYIAKPGPGILSLAK